MPRPARYSVDELLDAAAALLAADGPAAVTMSAVARATGAPSGSMYHRFPTRAVLCGELWMRTEERFHAGFDSALSASDDPQARCVAGAGTPCSGAAIIRVEAQVLLAGADALCLADWPDRADGAPEAFAPQTAPAAAGLPADVDRVNAAVIDIPYAVVRRHLIARRAIPASAGAIVEQCARVLIPPG